MSREEEVLEQMRVIIDPDLGKDIVSLGFIKDLEITDEGEVRFKVELTTPACPVKDQFKAACEREVRKLGWVQDVEVTMTAQRGRAMAPSESAGLKEVSNLVAVSSCKGGVGKSTVAVNLAYTLARSGAAVGIFDADIYGPSMPTMLRPPEANVMQDSKGMIIPLELEGVKLMSFGYINQGPEAGPAIMRGPMVTQVISQLLPQTNWGTLDYLIIDFPPGTGDIQLTLTQLLPLSAAVIVTTPQNLSFVDVVKGIQMFDKLKVPTVAVVENMSYFDCSGCGTKHYPFGHGARQKLVDQFGIANSFEIPIDPSFSLHGDQGCPLVLADPKSDLAATYQKLSDAVVREISTLKFGGLEKPRVSFSAEKGLIISLSDGTEMVRTATEIRQRCRCALCIDEVTGQQLLDPSSVPNDIYPTSIRTMGNYAVAITWSDGHTSSIYPYESLLAEEPAAKT